MEIFVFEEEGGGHFLEVYQQFDFRFDSFLDIITFGHFLVISFYGLFISV